MIEEKKRVRSVRKAKNYERLKEGFKWACDAILDLIIADAGSHSDEVSDYRAGLIRKIEKLKRDN